MPPSPTGILGSYSSSMMSLTSAAAAHTPPGMAILGQLKLQFSPGGQEANQAAAAQASESLNMCGAMLARVHEALSVIAKHDLFKDIMSMNALSEKEGGQQASFNQQKFLDTCGQDSKRTYCCAANFWWQNFTWLANHRVPLNDGQIKELQRFHLQPGSPPTYFNFTTVVALDSGDVEVTTMKGGLQRISPPEPTFAVLFSIKEAIEQKVSDKVLLQWRAALLTAPFRFEIVLPGDARYWRSQNLRQEIMEAGQVAALSIRQWVRVVKYYKEHMQYAGET